MYLKCNKREKKNISEAKRTIFVRKGRLTGKRTFPCEKNTFLEKKISSWEKERVAQGKYQQKNTDLTNTQWLIGN